MSVYVFSVAWGSPLTTEGIAQVSQLIDYLMIDQSELKFKYLDYYIRRVHENC